MIYHYHSTILTNGIQEYVEDVNITKDPPKDTYCENTEEKSENENLLFFKIDGNDIVKLDKEEYPKDGVMMMDDYKDDNKLINLYIV